MRPRSRSSTCSARAVDDWRWGAPRSSIGWIFQAIGHAVYEKNSPAFFRNVVHLLVGPAFLWNEALRLRSDRPRRLGRRRVRARQQNVVKHRVGVIQPVALAVGIRIDLQAPRPTGDGTTYVVHDDGDSGRLEAMALVRSVLLDGDRETRSRRSRAGGASTSTWREKSASRRRRSAACGVIVRGSAGGMRC